MKYVDNVLLQTIIMFGDSQHEYVLSNATYYNAMDNSAAINVDGFEIVNRWRIYDL